MKNAVLLAVAMGALSLAGQRVDALEIEVVSFDDNLFGAILTGIETVEDRVFVVNPETGEISFGDGASGARPPSGSSNVIASYRTGSGGEGNIVNEYDLVSVTLPLLIPLAEFLDGQAGDNNVSFVLVGVSELAFELTDEGLLVTRAELARPVPEPATLALLGIGLAVLGAAWGLRSHGIRSYRSYEEQEIPE